MPTINGFQIYSLIPIGQAKLAYQIIIMRVFSFLPNDFFELENLSNIFDFYCIKNHLLCNDISVEVEFYSQSSTLCPYQLQNMILHFRSLLISQTHIFLQQLNDILFNIVKKTQNFIQIRQKRQFSKNKKSFHDGVKKLCLFKSKQLQKQSIKSYFHEILIKNLYRKRKGKIKNQLNELKSLKMKPLWIVSIFISTLQASMAFQLFTKKFC